MRLGDDQEYLIIAASQEAYEGGDVLLDIDVRIGEFSAAIGTIVVRDDWRAFVAAVAELERVRRGEALLQSGDERELSLRFYASDRVGHMAISGQLARIDLPSQPKFTFGPVQFDPTLLPEFVRELAAVLASANAV